MQYGTKTWNHATHRFWISSQINVSSQPDISSILQSAWPHGHAALAWSIDTAFTTLGHRPAYDQRTNETDTGTNWCPASTNSRQPGRFLASTRRQGENVLIAAYAGHLFDTCSGNELILVIAPTSLAVINTPTRSLIKRLWLKRTPYLYSHCPQKRPISKKTMSDSTYGKAYSFQSY